MAIKRRDHSLGRLIIGDTTSSLIDQESGWRTLWMAGLASSERVAEVPGAADARDEAHLLLSTTVVTEHKISSTNRHFMHWQSAVFCIPPQRERVVGEGNTCPSQ